ncbi:alkaline phosphatase D family protein [Actinomadura alba]|uniref:Alkaline phosphatase D family protein n=1 Tax=Actinomadura alba TaxID=406431 RepID=A0ABR7LIK9_9ACTN|nr:alkaline phosphatase D family protein [Actinomadura alba]MBC6464618.1 alkaline phosphatase D family protein [Actinomadura alba]
MVLDRRTFLRTGLVAGGVVGGGTILGAGASAVAAPSLVRGGRPQLTHGVQSGDVTAHGGVVWTRSDRTARMLVDVSDRPDFKHARTIGGPLLTADTDFTGKTFLTGLPSGRQIHYRVRLDGDRISSAPTVGGFRTPSSGSSGHRDINFVWSGDLAGQGWGINPDFGGYRIFKSMAALEPDFFLCSGDFVYSDGPLTETVTLPDGRTWRNLVTAEKAKVAETLAEYRGQFRYNLLDANLRAFNAAVPTIYQWDDHEVVNNWYPGEILDDARYTEKRVDVLAARARQATIEYTPSAIRGANGRMYRKIEHGGLLDVFVVDMRTYKDPNGANNSTSGPGLLGAEQLAWLKRELRASKATWKVIAADLPIGLIVPDGTASEGIAQGDGGRPLGREREIADLLSYAKRHRVKNMVWLTADVHYTAAHFYDPAKAAFSDFDPFWEFVSGPLNAGAFGPNNLEGTFGPQLRFAKTPPAANSSPAEGFQFFGEVSIDAESKELTVRLRDLNGTVLYTTDLHPAR